MSGKAQHQKDHVGITNAVVAGMVALDFAVICGSFWQLMVPAIEASSGFIPIYRLMMLGVLAACIAWPFLMVWLGGADKKSEHRNRYLSIRNSLAADNIGHFYARGIRSMLVRVDRFFEGDGRPAEAPAPIHGRGIAVLRARASRFLKGDGTRGAIAKQRAFGLQSPAPLWTPQSYDRCLLIALLYPLVVIYLAYTWSGNMDSAEVALHLIPNDILKVVPSDFAFRVAGLLAIFANAGGLWVFQKYDGWQRWLGMAIAAVAFSFSIGINGLALSIVAAVLAGAYVGAGVLAGTLAVAIGFNIIVAISFSMFDASYASRFVGTFAIIIANVFTWAGTIAIAFRSIPRLGEIHRRRGFFLALVSLALLVASIIIPRFISHIAFSFNTTVLLYFLGVLTLINAPFDWLALGVTRGLLRRGLERGGVWPMILGIADLVLSILLMLALAVAALWATELFNHMAALGGFKAPVDPAALFPSLLAAPFAPEHLWLIAMLFSTQIPALLNLMFGTFCLLRGLPRINRWIMAQLPESGGIGVWQRLSITSIYAGQLGAAVVIGLIAFYYLFVHGLIWLLDAVFGPTLIDILNAVSIAGWLAR